MKVKIVCGRCRGVGMQGVDSFDPRMPLCRSTCGMCGGRGYMFSTLKQAQQVGATLWAGLKATYYPADVHDDNLRDIFREMESLVQKGLRLIEGKERA